MARPNVLWIAGVNGVGKSTLTRHLGEFWKEPPIITCSGTLMKAFGVTERESLALFTEKEKITKLEEAALTTFEENQESEMIIFDTHLIVPIRVGTIQRVEYQWFQSHIPFIRMALLLIAEPELILSRRINDYEATGRRRDFSANNIKTDQSLNKEAFQRLVAPSVNSMVIDTTETEPEMLAKTITQRWNVWDVHGNRRTHEREKRYGTTEILFSSE